ncbi:MAG: MauE/DoxX family redox-associated membrane protein [Salibacteraceae bacterium]
MNVLIYILRVLISLIFIASGITKLYPIEPFELTLVDVGLSGWLFAPFFARILIAVEVFLGLAILFNTKYIKTVIKATLGLTGFFTFYLLLLWAFRGNDMNCGCFGQFLLLTPVESIIKNLFLLVIIYAILNNQEPYTRKLKWVYPTVLVVSFVLPFVLNMISIKQIKEDTAVYPYPFQAEFVEDQQLKDLGIIWDENEYLLAFFSSKCPHCKTAAQKLAIEERKFEFPKVKVFIKGTPESIDVFFKESNAAFPYVIVESEDIIKFTKGSFPTFYLIKNGKVHKKWIGDFSNEELENLSKDIKKY